MIRVLQGIFIAAAGVLVAAGFLDVVRSIEPPQVWPLALVVAAILLVIAYAIETLGGT